MEITNKQSGKKFSVTVEEAKTIANSNIGKLYDIPQIVEQPVTKTPLLEKPKEELKEVNS